MKYGWEVVAIVSCGLGLEAIQPAIRQSVHCEMNKFDDMMSLLTRAMEDLACRIHRGTKMN